MIYSCIYMVFVEFWIEESWIQVKDSWVVFVPENFRLGHLVVQ